LSNVVLQEARAGQRTTLSCWLQVANRFELFS